ALSFFFSSRRRHTRFSRDWSSDVCSSDLTAEDFVFALEHIKENGRPLLQQFWQDLESAEALDEHRVRFDFATTGTRKTLAMAAKIGRASCRESVDRREVAGAGDNKKRRHY